MATQTEQLNEIKLRREIEKLELEKAELKKMRWRYWVTSLLPLCIAFVSGYVILKSNFFQDLQIKIDNQKTEFKKDTMEFGVQKRAILSTIFKLKVESSVLRDSVDKLSDKAKKLDSTNREFLKNANRTVSQLVSQNLRDKSAIDDLVKELEVSVKMTDSLQKKLEMDVPAAYNAALFKYYRVVVDKIYSKPIRTQEDQQNLFYSLEAFYQMNIKPTPPPLSVSK